MTSISTISTRLFLFCLLAALTACSSSQNDLTSSTSPQAKLSPVSDPAYHIIASEDLILPIKGTFSLTTKLFKVGHEGDLDVDAVDKRITHALRSTLKSKGFQEAATGEAATISIGYAVSLDAHITEAELNKAYQKALPIKFPKRTEDRDFISDLSYHEGTLIIDVIDNTHQQLLWRGAVMGQVRLDVDDKIKDQRVQKVISYLFERYPAPKA